MQQNVKANETKSDIKFTKANVRALGSKPTCEYCNM